MKRVSSDFNGRGSGGRYLKAAHKALQKYRRDKNPAAVALVNSYWRKKRNAARDIKESDARSGNQDAGGGSQVVQGADDQDRKTD